MSLQNQAIVFNAVPLFVLAAACLAVTAALAPSLRRARAHPGPADLALALMFPCLAVAAAVYGAVVLHDRQPLGGQVWPTFGATLVALVPPLLLVFRRSDRALAVEGLRRGGGPEGRVSPGGRGSESVRAVSGRLAASEDPDSAARLLLDEAARLFTLDFTALVLVDEDAREATGILARAGGEDVDWWPGMTLDLEREPSAVASAVFEAAPVSIFDLAASSVASGRLIEATGAKSGVWVPIVSQQQVIGVLVALTTVERRAFTPADLELMQAIAAEASVVLERTRSASALAGRLDRERLVARIAGKVRSEADLAAVLRVAVEETGRALGAARCFIRLGSPGKPTPIAAEWRAEGVAALEKDAAARLPASNLAAQERRTVALADVAAAPELEDESLGGRRALLELGVQAVLATPIVLFDRLVGVVSLHRAEAGPWPPDDVALAESVAREVGLAIHTSELLAENERRLEQQAALLKAAQVVTSELRVETVIQRLVDEVAELLDADAADCYLYDVARGTLRCAAVHGLDAELVGFEFPSTAALAGEAMTAGRPVLSYDYENLGDAVPHSAYVGFSGALVAPMAWGDETRGVLGVGVRTQRREFDQADADLLEAFASLASLALRNAESFEQRSRQAQIQRGFYRIAKVLSEPLSLPETLDALAQAASEAFGGAFAAVLMPESEKLRLAGSHQLPPTLESFLWTRVADSPGPLSASARAKRLLSAPAIGGDDRFAGEWQGLAPETGFCALLAIPVEAPRGGEGGLVVVFFAEERAFTDADLELARNLAGAARGALERSQLFESERSSRALSQQLARTGSVLATELEPTAILDEVVRRAPELLGAGAASIRLLESDELVVSAAYGHGAEAALGSRAPSTARLAGDVVQSRAPVAVESVGGDDRLLQAEPVLAAGYDAYLGVPLVGPEGALHGVLAVYARESRSWREEEIEALGALAGNASAALSNAELYQRVALEKERSFAILANIADGIVAVDRDGKVVLWNNAAELITGVPAAEALGRTPAQVLQRGLESEGEAPPGNRLVSIRRAGQEVWLSLTEAVMRDPAGLVAGRIFAFRDISSERVVEQMKSDFVSAVSHELRTPLTSIYGFAETLLRQDVLFGEEERRTFLGYIASESERLTNIVDALLNVARLDTGDLQVQLAPTDVRAIVSEVVTSAEQAEAEPANGHRFVVDVPEEPLDAEADREKLRQIISNLVDNAVRYSPEGGTVTVAARKKEDAVEVRVVDEGIGIPQAEQQRIFSKFYRAEASARDSGGTGLGLFIAQGLVTAMGGRIWVQSAEGEGSSFVFELPLAREPALA